MGDSNVKKPIPLPTGFNSWLDYAIATMDARGAFLDHMFTDDHIPSQEDIRAAAKAELDALRASAAPWVQDQEKGESRTSNRKFPSASVSQSAEDYEWLNFAPVGREFGSPDYEKLMEQDMKEFQTNLSSLIEVCSDLADAKTGDAAPEERQDAVNVQRALQELGQPVSLEVAAEVWRHHSKSLMAGWMAGAETIESARKTLFFYCMNSK
jgi:hypothetical protein